ncbi:hypothetical protein HKD37_07G019606 [Glycine soja]
MHFEHSEYSVAGDSEYSDFEHLTTNFHTENIAQPPPHERTLREMTAPDFTYESLCIQYPDEGVPYVLKTGLIHLLPKFHGLIGEDPHKHLKEFHIVCSTMKPPDVQEDHIFLKAFPHSLEWQKIDYTTLLPDHHTDLCPSLQQSGVNEQPEAYATNIDNRPPQQQNQ